MKNPISELLIATKNIGKFHEIMEVFDNLEIKTVSLAELGITDDVEENGTTHEENAIIKARYFFSKTGKPTLAEDSGIYVDEFKGELGVQTRRWNDLGEKSDEEWIKVFLEKMANVPKEKRGAEFHCFAALIIDEISAQKPFIFSGVTRGTITEKLEAPLKAGIPISSCFRPEGCEKVYAALTAEEKNQVSHRGKAMRSAKEFLKKLL